MNLTVKIKCDNAAFKDDFHGELAQLFKRVRACVEPDSSGWLHDTNGNRVGYWLAEKGE